MKTHGLDAEQVKVMTLEAYADTIVPGEKRWPGDRAVAGISEGGGAVAGGAIALLETPEGGMAPAMDNLAEALNTHAEKYAADNGLVSDETVPAFVALSAQDRVELVSILCKPGHPEKVLWSGLALFCNMAFDTGAHMHTLDALAAGHPGLLAIGYAQPESDGLWRFPDFSYRRALSNMHPDTTPTGSPA
jgi:hypothetical protein